MDYGDYNGATYPNDITFEDARFDYGEITARFKERMTTSFLQNMTGVLKYFD